MIKNRLLQKYFLLAAIIVVLFVVLGFFLTGFIARALHSPKDAKEGIPPIFLAKIVDNLKAPSKLAAIQQMHSFHQDRAAIEAVLINDEGKIIYPQDPPSWLPTQFDVNDLNKLEKPYDYFYLKGIHPEPPLGMGLPLPPGMGPGRPGAPGGPGGPPGGPGGGPPGFNRGIAVIRLEGTPRFYMVIMPPQFREPPPGAMSTSEKLIPFLGIGSLILSLLIGIGATLFLIYISVFKKIKEADQVISELQKGNLKARFNIIRQDEFGEAMQRFNKMADEIEKLVEQMKFAELARTKLLQELAHDLRTPIAAMKSLLETLESKEAVLDSATKKEIIALSLRETHYFEHLIEDLLLLSQVSEPNYGSNQQEEINLKDLLSEEVEDQDFRARNDGKEKKLEFVRQIENSNFKIMGNRVLLRRMLKNIFTNATSFAKNEIQVQLKSTAGGVEIVIADDGPGFLPEQLQSFGSRKMSRQVIREQNNHERLSIGLGSVVIKKICDLHRGELQVDNLQTASQNKTGARLTLRFKSI